MKLPAFQFYPADWRKDPGVQSLSYHDRGVWFEILCLMHESEQRGKLLLNGAPMPEDALARLLGLDKQILTKTLTTLLSYGVASRDDETGALVSRRMVRDEELRKIRKEAGKMGGNPVLLNQNPNQNPEPGLTKNQPLQSSPSVSSSSSEKSVCHAHARGNLPPPVAVYAEVYGDDEVGRLAIHLQTRFETEVTDLEVWRKTLKRLKSNNIPASKGGTLLEAYADAVSKANGRASDAMGAVLENLV